LFQKVKVRIEDELEGSTGKRRRKKKRYAVERFINLGRTAFMLLDFQQREIHFFNKIFKTFSHRLRVDEFFPSSIFN
jgi:CelD/BcsL family acetyltransferase involved in cellulose biosynthesis